ncbi:MAG: DNA polymerase III subunit beta [Actinomycetia bacterium]|nr:DNA polymerase III subunit beta [Actinomycetes bacterium]
MKIETTRTDLLNCIMFASRVISSKNTNYVLSGLMMEADQELNVYSTDLETNIRTSIKAKIIDKGKLVVPSRILLNILKNFPESKVELEFNQETNQLKITCQKAAFNLNTFPLEEFPQFPEIKKDNSFFIDIKKFKKLVNKTQRSVSNDEGRVILTGVLCEINNSILRMVSTDSYRLSFIEEKLKDLKDNTSVVIPGKVLDNITKTETDDGKLEINIESSQISFGIMDKNGFKATIVSRLLTGKFPDYKQLIPKNIKHNILVDREKLLEVVKRISSISQDNIPISLELVDGNMKVFMDIKEVGSSSEDFKVPYGEEKISIAFNPQFLIDGINMIEGKNIILGVEESLKPVLLKQEQNENLFYLLMPIRIS